MGTRNTLKDLNNHLFEQLERISDISIDDENLSKEINRSKAVSIVAKNIIDNGKLVLDAEKFKDDRLAADKETPRMLEG